MIRAINFPPGASVNPEQVPIVGKIELVLLPSGEVRIGAQVPNEVIARGMLSKGADLLSAFFAKQQQPDGIQPAPPGFSRLLGNKN